jgi:hypothetical protein
MGLFWPSASPPSLPGSIREAVGRPPSTAPAFAAPDAPSSAIKHAGALANSRAGHRREIRINESGIEQTVVAFDVTLKCRHLSRERDYPL